MTRPVFMINANITSKLAFGRTKTKDVGALRSVRATVTRWTCRGQQNGKGESAHGHNSLHRYLMSYTTRRLMTFNHHRGEYGVVK